MKAMITLVVALITTTLNVVGQPIVTSPTAGQICYPGETVQIRWTSTRPDAWNSVYIMLQDAGGTGGWIAFGAPNTGSFDWVVGKWNTTTNFVVHVSDGGNATNTTSVAIIIQNGVRPKPVKVAFFRGVVIEWASIPGHTYRVERSTDSVLWEIISESTVDFIDSYIVDYTGGQKFFHRVLDITNGSQLVDVTVSRSVSLEWTSIPGHTYRVVKSVDLVAWETVAEGTVDFTNAYFDDYAEDARGFYRVLDLNP